MFVSFIDRQTQTKFSSIQLLIVFSLRQMNINRLDDDNIIVENCLVQPNPNIPEQ